MGFRLTHLEHLNLRGGKMFLINNKNHVFFQFFLFFNDDLKAPSVYNFSFLFGANFFFQVKFFSSLIWRVAILGIVNGKFLSLRGSS